MSESSSAALQSGLSSLCTRKSSFLWKISNFRDLDPKFYAFPNEPANDYAVENFKGLLESPKFFANSDDFKWSLIIFSFNGGLSFKLQNDDHVKKNSIADVDLSISIIKNDGEKLTKTQHCLILPLSYRHSDDILHYSDYIETGSDFFQRNCCSEYLLNFVYLYSLFDQKKGFFKNDCDLHVLCEYSISTFSHENNQILTFKSQDLINSCIIDTLDKQWKDQEFCDYELIAPCGGKLAAHKFVLSARSPVFSAMLKTDMKEKRDNFVKIEDISYEALKQMLCFMYSGKIEKLDDDTVGVLAAADKYQIPDLKEVCKEFLLNNLSIENAMKTLKLCKVHNLDDLQSHVDSFIKSNVKSIYCKNIELLSIDQTETDNYVKVIHDMAEKLQLNN